MLAAGLQKQILIVDRDLATVEPLRQKLSESGFVVRAITDGAAALTALRERPPHLVVIDWNIPGYSALELIQCVRDTRVPQAVRLIILSALCGEHDVIRGLESGADDYIAKPYSLRETVARISVLLRVQVHRCEPRTFDRLTLDSTTHRVTAQGAALNLRGAEPTRRGISIAGIPHVASRARFQSQPVGGSRVGWRLRCGRKNRGCERAAAAKNP
jgi:two-component system, OmpR family, phosphate regulon response regulator PhoB